MALDVRLVNMTTDPIEIDDGIGGRLLLPVGVAVWFPGDVAGPDLRKLIADGSVVIEDEPPDIASDQ